MNDTKKESFYKTADEKLLARAVDQLYNDEIGCNENSMMDGHEYYAWQENELIEWISSEIIKGDRWLELPDTLVELEPKHFRFMSAKRIREIVDHRVKYRHTREGQWEWEADNLTGIQNEGQY